MFFPLYFTSKVSRLYLAPLQTSHGTYTSGKKSVAAVDKNGKITAKKKGTVTIKAKVTLKNGKTKTVSMKIKVK